MVSKSSLNIRDLIDDARLNGLHLQVLAIAFSTAIIDGVDNQAIGFSAAAIGRSLHIPNAAFGAIFSAGTLGTLCGAVCCGILADRIGRQRTLVFCTALFAVLTLLTPFAGNVTALVALRFSAGIGLGGAMPAFLTLVSEYSPRRYKGMSTGLLWCGYPIGGTLGSLAGSFIVPHYGWKVMFDLGGGIALLIVVLQTILLPESLTFLVMKKRNEAAISRLVRRLHPGLSSNGRFHMPTNGRDARTGIAALFRGRAVLTVLLWMIFFFTFIIVNFFVLWAPLLFRIDGMAISTAALMVSVNNLASIPSEVASGWLIDRGNAYVVIALAALALLCSTVMLSLFLGSVPVVAAVMAIIGFMEGSAVSGVLYLVTNLYPSEIRSTAVGWAVGFGRFGQVAASLVIGWLLSRGATPGSIVLGMCLPPLTICLCVAAVSRWRPSCQVLRHV